MVLWGAPISKGSPGRIGLRHETRAVLALVLLFSLALVVTGAQIASAEPQAITQAKKQAATLQARVDELNNQVDVLVEKYDSANVKLGQIRATAMRNAATLKQAQQDQATAEGRLSTRLVQIYEQGTAGSLDVLLSADSWSDLLNRMVELSYVSGEDRALVAQVTTYRMQVADEQAKLAEEVKQQQAAAAQVQADKQAVEAKLAANKQSLAGEDQQIAQMEEAWQAQQAKLAAEARAAAAQAALKAQQAREAAQKAALAREASASSGGQVRVTVPVSGNGANAAQAALKYLGVPYVWGGASPSGFDCSGLVMYVYGQLGVNLPHSAAMQYGYGTHVSRDQLEPGDLVFYGSPIHHVGIYVGNGDMVDAPYTGVSVRIDPLQSDYAGATRFL